MAKGRKLTEIQKEAVVRAHVRGEPVKTIAQANRVSETSVNRIVAEAKRTGLYARLEGELLPHQIEQRIMSTGTLEVRYIFEKAKVAEKGIALLDKLAADMEKKLAGMDKQLAAANESIRSLTAMHKAAEQNILLAQNFVKGADRKLGEMEGMIKDSEASMKGMQQNLILTENFVRSLDEKMSAVSERMESLESKADASVRSVEHNIALLNSHAKAGDEKIARLERALQSQEAASRSVLSSLRSLEQGISESYDEKISDLLVRMDSLEETMKSAASAEDAEQLVRRLAEEQQKISRKLEQQDAAASAARKSISYLESHARGADESFEKLYNILKVVEQNMLVFENHVKNYDDVLERHGNMLRAVEENMSSMEGSLRTLDEIKSYLDSIRSGLAEIRRRPVPVLEREEELPSR